MSSRRARPGLASLAIALSGLAAGCGGSTPADTGASSAAGAGGSPGAGGSGVAGTSAAGTSAKGGGAGAGGSGAAGMGGFAGKGGGAGGAGAGGAATGGSDPGPGGAGGSDPGTGGAGGDGAAGAAGDAGAPPFSPAPHPPYPVIPKGSGTVLASIQLITITFDGYAGKDHVEGLGDAIVQSEWLATVGADYGVGKGTHLAKVVLAETAPATMDSGEIPVFLGQRINSGVLPKPPGPNDYLYMIYFPPTTTVTINGGNGGGCAQQGFGGYHESFQSGGVRIAYGVIPTCFSANSIERYASHELIEAATDPAPNSKVTYRFDSFSEPWAAPGGGGEVGDVCDGLPWPEGMFTYQRSWSKSAAAAGKEPCVPTMPGMAAFSVAPSPSGSITIAAGQSGKITLTGWSDAPIANWHLGSTQFAGDFAASVKFSSFLINNGFTSDMTITVPAGVSPGSVSPLFVTSTLSGEAHYWPIIVHVK